MAGDTVTLFDHLMALRAMDARLAEERDRRYAEVASEREKALKIKDEADSRALILAREIQGLKDEKANNLRSQIESERGTYVTQTEFKPVTEFVNRSTGRSGGMNQIWGYIVAVIAMAFALWQALGK